MNHDKAGFYFANLGADVLRCANAAENAQPVEYESSLERAYRTLRRLEEEGRPEAHEEGLLLLRGLEYARASGMIPAFRKQLNDLIAPFAARLGFS